MTSSRLPITPAIARRARRLRAAACVATLVMLSGCSLLGGKPREPITVYAPDPRVEADAGWPSVPWQLSLTTPTASRMDDSARIAVRLSPTEVQIYKGATWGKRPTEMLGDSVLRALEDSGKVAAVARQGSGINADYKLGLDIRRFESDYAGQAVPSAVIEVTAKLLHGQDQQVALSRTFVHTQAAATTALPDVITAFEGALKATSRDIAGWVLVEGDRHERDKHR